MPTRPGPIFPDPGLAVAVLGALLDAELIDEATVTAALAGIAGEEEEGEGARVAEALRRLQQIELDAAALATITSLDFDGGNEIYLLIEGELDIDTGGEEDYYCLHSLEGIAALGGLETLDLDSYGWRPEGLDLAPLTGHPALHTLRLHGPAVHAAALETLPRLARLTATAAELDDPQVARRLAARGVEVSG